MAGRRGGKAGAAKGLGDRKGAAAGRRRRRGSHSWPAAWPLPFLDMTSLPAWLAATWLWPWHMTPAPPGEGCREVCALAARPLLAVLQTGAARCYVWELYLGAMSPGAQLAEPQFSS